MPRTCSSTLRRTRDARLRASSLVLAIAGLSIGTAHAQPEGPGFAITSSVVSAGGGFVDADCYTLVSTIGEPVAGTVSVAAMPDTPALRLTSGFLARDAAKGDLLFRTGFDPKKGNCAP